MTRKEILNAAKAAGIKEVNGVNFTRCSNDVLLAELSKTKKSKIAEKKYNTEVKQPVDRKQLMAQLKSVGYTTIDGVSYTRCSNEVLQKAWNNYKATVASQGKFPASKKVADASSIDTATNKKEIDALDKYKAAVAYKQKQDKQAKPKAKTIDMKDAYKACFLTALTLLDAAGLLDDLIKEIKVHP